jgi:hypothetical protein
MSETAILEKLNKLTHAVERLAERIEDLRDLEEAIAENGDKPLIPWEQVKRELEID